MSLLTVRQALGAVLGPAWMDLLRPTSAWTVVQMPDDDDLAVWEVIKCVPLPSRAWDWMGIVLVNAAKDRFLAWGVVRVAPLLLAAPEGALATAWTIPRLTPDQCLRSVAPPASWHIDYALPADLPTRHFNLDELAGLLRVRLAQYQSPTDACLVATPDARRMDRLSFAMASAAIARYRGMYPTIGASSLTRWIRGEQRIALYRFRCAHLADASALRVRPDWLPPGYAQFCGPDVLDATELLPLAHQAGTALLHRGRLLVSPDHAMALLPVVLRQADATVRSIAAVGRFPSFRDHACLMNLLDSFHRHLDTLDVPTVVPERKKQHMPLLLNGGEPILASATLDELKTTMPACIRSLADRAFLPGTPHLKYEERSILYGFVLANGVPAVVLEQRALAKVASIPGYDARQVSMQVNSTDKHVRDSTKFGMGHGCPGMQDKGHCVWFNRPATGSGEDVVKQARSNARVACHANQLALAKLHTDPRGRDWKIGYPLAFAQQVKQWLK